MCIVQLNIEWRENNNGAISLFRGVLACLPFHNCSASSSSEQQLSAQPRQEGWQLKSTALSPSFFLLHHIPFFPFSAVLERSHCHGICIHQPANLFLSNKQSFCSILKHILIRSLIANSIGINRYSLFIVEIFEIQTHFAIQRVHRVVQLIVYTRIYVCANNQSSTFANSTKMNAVDKHK